jgi:hypothetical protein
MKAGPGRGRKGHAADAKIIPVSFRVSYAQAVDLARAGKARGLSRHQVAAELVAHLLTKKDLTPGK